MMKLKRTAGHCPTPCKLPTPVGKNSRLFLLAPPLFLFYQTDPFIAWILVAVALGIVLIFILIAFILRPLTRRSQKKKARKRQVDIETRPGPVIAPEIEVDDLDDTAPAAIEAAPQASQAPTIPAITKDEADTMVSPLKVVAEPITTPISGERPPNVNWQFAALTDVGLKRELNEDNLIIIEGEMPNVGPYGLYVVADGLGGHEAGEVASQLTVDAIKQHHDENPPTVSDAPYEEWLKSAVLAANEVVLARQQGAADRNKMGSTLVMALIAGENAHIVNVGDSRAYRLNSEKIEQISIDHSLVERLVQIGQITREEARTHKQRNVIYSTIGEKDKLEIGSYHVAVTPQERLLLCSDGLSGMVSDEELQHISDQYPNPAQASQMMVEAAKRAGGNDNITVILIQMNGD